MSKYDPPSEPLSERDALRILGLTTNADPAAVRAAYRRLAKEYHPDHGGLRFGRQAFDRLVAAYRIALHAAEMPPKHAASRRSAGSDPAASEGNPDTSTTGTGHSGNFTTTGSEQDRWRRTAGGDQGRRKRRSRGQEQRLQRNIADTCRRIREGRTPRVRARACAGAASLGTRSVYSALREALYDESEEVQCAALRAVVDLEVRQSASDLIALMTAGVSDRVADLVLTAAERLAGAPGMEEVARLAMRRSSYDLRRRAVRVYSAARPAGENRGGEA